MPSTYAPRTFSSLQQQFPAYFQEMEIEYPDDFPVYVGVPDDGNPQTYPSLTVIPNLRSRDGRLVMGQAFGHHQARQPDSPNTIEVYEYHSHGAMVIDRDGEPTVDFIYAQPGDKILVPPDCHMTLSIKTTSPSSGSSAPYFLHGTMGVPCVFASTNSISTGLTDGPA